MGTFSQRGSPLNCPDSIFFIFFTIFFSFYLSSNLRQLQSSYYPSVFQGRILCYIIFTILTCMQDFSKVSWRYCLHWNHIETLKKHFTSIVVLPIYITFKDSVAAPNAQLTTLDIFSEYQCRTSAVQLSIPLLYIYILLWKAILQFAMAHWECICIMTRGGIYREKILSTREILRAEPEGFSEGSGYNMP